MTFRGNVIIQAPRQANTGQIFAIYNDEASGSPVSFQVTALYNTVVGAGGHAAFVHLSNATAPDERGLDDNIVSGTSVRDLVEDGNAGTVTGTNNWLQTGTATDGLTGSVIGTEPRLQQRERATTSRPPRPARASARPTRP